MEYKRICSDRFDEVIQFLRDTFFVDEPLNKAVNLTKPGLGHPESEIYSLYTLKEGVSVMAVSNDNRIAGVALNGILHPGETEKALETLSNSIDLRFRRIFKFLYEANIKLNLFKRFNIDRLFEVRILAVNPEGQGIARKLLEMCIKTAVEEGFRAIKLDATGLYSQKISESLGFVSCSEIYYDDYVDENGDKIFNVESPHKKMQILYKLLES